MNKKTKGRHHERVIAELFRQAGWAVHLVQPAIAYNPKTGRYYARPQDIFGADILAIKHLRCPVFIQVTCHSGIGQKARKFRIYPFPWPIVRVLIFQAKKISGKWKYKAIKVDQRAAETMNEYELIHIFGDLFWKRKELFWMEGSK